MCVVCSGQDVALRIAWFPAQSCRIPPAGQFGPRVANGAAENPNSFSKWTLDLASKKPASQLSGVQRHPWEASFFD